MRGFGHHGLYLGQRLVVCGLLLLAAADSHAGDGVIELNQTCAVQTGCVPGDAPLFPITLTARGSYRLTSNLEVPDENTNGIEIGSHDISIDFAGFTLLGPAFVPISNHVCTLPGSGVGVYAPPGGDASGFIAVNGRIRGMGRDGVDVFAANARIERMIIERNCLYGVRLGVTAFVADTQVRANGFTGIELNESGRVRDCIVDNNGLHGIETGAGSVVTGSIAHVNVQQGMKLGYGSVAMGNVIQSNQSGPGLSVGGGVATQNSAFGNRVNIDEAAIGLNAAGDSANGDYGGSLPIACNKGGFSPGDTRCPP